VAVLSRFPFLGRHPHTREGFMLNGRHFRVCRGFAEVTLGVNARYRFTLIAAHLKSRLKLPQADQADLREHEALVLRRIIDAHLKSNPKENLIVLGDMNDVPSSRPIRILVGRGRRALIDTRPTERDLEPSPRNPFHRDVTWTYYYGREDTYSRIDYILLSPGMAREWRTNDTYVPSFTGWRLASDHRPVIAGFIAEDR
jgi:endonuclease/exonuclease/phosphatase family metal-dependent hydrolase